MATTAKTTRRRRVVICDSKAERVKGHSLAPAVATMMAQTRVSMWSWAAREPVSSASKRSDDRHGIGGRSDNCSTTGAIGAGQDRAAPTERRAAFDARQRPRKMVVGASGKHWNTVSRRWEERERRRLEILASLDEAEASLARGEGRPIAEDSMKALAEDVKQRGRARLAAERNASH